MNEIKIFENPEFGKVRTVVINDEPWFVGKDVAVALGYAQTSNMKKIIYAEDCQEIDPQNRMYTGFIQNGVTLEPNKNTRRMLILNESGLYQAIFGSKLPNAKEFKHWVTSEVLPSIRKTGNYTVKPTVSDKELNIRLLEAEAKQAEAKSRQSELWMKLADRANIPDFKQIADTYAANTLAGKEVIALPEVNKKTYSATDIGNILGVFSNKIGRLAHKLNMKVPEYGKYFYDKAKGCNKQVETFRYFENAIDVFREALKEE